MFAWICLSPFIYYVTLEAIHYVSSVSYLDILAQLEMFVKMLTYYLFNIDGQQWLQLFIYYVTLKAIHPCLKRILSRDVGTTRNVC